VILYFLERAPEPPHARVGITVSRKVGGAVERHRIKRRIREIYRRWDERSLLPPLDLVVHVLPVARRADFQALEKDLLSLLRPLVQYRREP
jgi:ribonuclease P protein component